GWESHQRPFKPQSGIARDYGNADLLAGHRRDKYLAAWRPMNLRHVRPRLHLKVVAKAESFPWGDARIKPRPFADPRILAIGADKPAIGKLLFRSPHKFFLDFHYARAPAALHARLAGVVDEMLMQLYTPHGIGQSARKFRPRGMFRVHKPDSQEWKGAFRRQGDAERS